MKKKPKMIFKVNRNRTAKLYINGKWIRKITRLDIHAEPLEYFVELERCRINKNGMCYVENDEIAKETKFYKI